MRKTTYSRRDFLKSSAAAGITAYAGSQPAPGQERASPTYDVAIVGAGLSGLTTARRLVLSGVDNLVVLEARDRVGGRTINHDIGQGRVAEGGGQWIGPTQTAVLDLCKELGVGTFPTYLEGNLVYLLGGRRMEVPYGATTSGPGPLEERIDELAGSVPLQAPWKAARAAEWDAMSLADWMRGNVTNQQDVDSLRNAAALTLSTTAERLSFLYFLFYVHSAGSLHDLESMRGGAQDSRIVGGSQVLCLKMAESLGSKIRLRSPVKRISHAGPRLKVETASGTVEARHVVMALMPGSCTGIIFDPRLPEPRRKLQERWVRRGSAVKYNVVYTKPFWRDQGLNGMSISDAPAVPFTTDNSPPDGSLGVILILTGRASLADDPVARKSQILDQLVKVFGEEAQKATGFHEMDWSAEEFTGGCVSPLEPGVLTRYGAALRESIGPLHWAGTETSEVWTGYMDGAVRAGGRIARHLLREIKA